MAADGAGTSGSLKQHLECCAKCGEDAGVLSGREENSAIPQWFTNAVRREFPGSSGESRSQSIGDFLRDSFGKLAGLVQTPSFAVGAVAASLLVIVFFSVFPGGEGPVIALSTVDWDRPVSTLQPKTGMTLMGPAETRTKAAIVLRFASQKEASSQANVDALYTQLNPRRTLKTRFDFLSPNQIASAIGEGAFTRLSLQDLSALLYTKFGVSLVAVATLQKMPDGYTIDTELIEPSSHKVLYRKHSGPFPESDPARHVKESLLEGLTEYARP
jgi:hypothetical protein